jgi:hypothetical protein
MHGALPKEGGTKEVSSWHVHLLKTKGFQPSYMAIKKALYMRQTGCFCFCFWCCSFFIVFYFGFGFFKVSSFTHLDLKDDIFSRVVVFYAAIYEKNLCSSELHDSCWSGFIFLSSIIYQEDLLNYLSWELVIVLL